MCLIPKQGWEPMEVELQKALSHGHGYLAGGFAAVPVSTGSSECKHGDT